MNIKDPKLLAEHLKKLIDPKVRQEMGIQTNEEIAAKTEAKLERDLHNQIIQEFNCRGIAYGHAQMNKKSTYTIGWPDFTFAVVRKTPDKSDPTAKVTWPMPWAWECKIGNAQLDPDQERIRHLLQDPPNAWYYKIIRSLQEACHTLKELGL